MPSPNEEVRILEFMRPSSVNVVICTAISDELLGEITRLDPRLNVADASARLLEALPSALRPGQRPPPDRSQGQTLHQLLAEAEIMLAARRLPADVRTRAPRLRWVQSPMAGVDWLKETDLWLDPGVLVTSASGINARAVAEYVMATALALSKNIPRMLDNKAEQRWDRFELGQLKGRTMGLVGYGAIGQEVASLAEAFGMNILAVKRRVGPEHRAPRVILPAHGLERLLRESDFVVLGVPSTPETAGMIGQAQLMHMRPSAYLINVSRGDVVDEQALIHALSQKRLAGAALDVFQSEPLPRESALWTMPNVLISSHVAGLFEEYDSAVVDLFIANLKRYLRGEPLHNAIDRGRA